MATRRFWIPLRDRLDCCYFVVRLKSLASTCPYVASGAMEGPICSADPCRDYGGGWRIPLCRTGFLMTADALQVIWVA